MDPTKVNTAVDILVNSIRGEIKNLMDAHGNINGFALLTALNTHKAKLHIATPKAPTSKVVNINGTKDVALRKFIMEFAADANNVVLKGSYTGDHMITASKFMEQCHTVVKLLDKK